MIRQSRRHFTHLLAPFLLPLGTAIGIGSVLAQQACTPTQREAAKTALDAADLGCVFASAVTDAEQLMEICRLAKPVLPVLRDLIGQREGAKRAGVRWNADAGVSDASGDAAPDARR